MRIIIAEDQEMGRLILARHLRRMGHEVIECVNGQEALDVISNDIKNVDMLITDWMMPVMDGIELAKKVRRLSKDSHYIYIILLTGRSESADKIEGFSQGEVDDYIVKGSEGAELQMRIQVGNRVIDAEHQLRHMNENLQSLVQEQTATIRDAQEEIVRRLFTALELRDGETGEHVQRIGLISACMGKLLGWDEERISVIRSAAPLHDIGKIAIPDSVLRKPGRLTEDEFDIIKTHAAVGADMLLNSQNPVIKMGECIARNHHENWDGSGYPQGLRGEEIPLEARVVSIADVFDALLSDRVYRAGLPEGKVIEILQHNSSKSFDEKLLKVFLDNLEFIKEYVNANLKDA